MSEKTKMVLPSSVTNPDGSVTVKLKHRIQFGEEIIEELKFVRPKAKHLKGLDLKAMTSDSMITLMSKITAQFPQALDELDLSDFVFCTEVIESFLDSSAKGGKTV